MITIAVQSPLPTGIVVISDMIMSHKWIADLLFDEFKFIEDRSTAKDRQMEQKRWLLASDKFDAGEVEYDVMIKSTDGEESVIGDVYPITVDADKILP